MRTAATWPSASRTTSFTQGDTWEQVRVNVQEAVAGYFFDQPKPKSIRLHLVRDELLTCE